jgi:hypothetical protein
MLLRLIVTCIVLEEITRTVLQEGPQKVEKVEAREWCQYQPGGLSELVLTERLLLDGKPIGQPQYTATLWTPSRTCDSDLR